MDGPGHHRARMRVAKISLSPAIDEGVSSGCKRYGGDESNIALLESQSSESQIQSRRATQDRNGEAGPRFFC